MFPLAVSYLMEITNTLSTQDGGLCLPGRIGAEAAIIAGLPGFEAFHFVDIAELAALDDEMQLAIFTELVQQIVDPSKLLLI